MIEICCSTWVWCSCDSFAYAEQEGTKRPSSLCSTGPCQLASLYWTVRQLSPGLPHLCGWYNKKYRPRDQWPQRHKKSAYVNDTDCTRPWLVGNSSDWIINICRIVGQIAASVESKERHSDKVWASRSLPTSQHHFFNSPESHCLPSGLSVEPQLRA